MNQADLDAKDDGADRISGMPNEIAIHRRKLPHWRGSCATYFVTWRVARGVKLLSAHERDAVVASLKFFDGIRYDLIAWVVMDDHVHVIVHPRVSLSSILHSWKSFTAHDLRRFGRRGSVWQDESFDRMIRDDAELREKVRYVLDNPSKRWPELHAYAWVGSKLLP